MIMRHEFEHLEMFYRGFRDEATAFLTVTVLKAGLVNWEWKKTSVT